MRGNELVIIFRPEGMFIYTLNLVKYCYGLDTDSMYRALY